jgi:putative addiction module CopG family antidote
MTIQLSPEQENVIHQAIQTGKYHSVDEVVDSALESIRQREQIPPALTRSQLAGQRIRELRKGAILGGLSIKELIEEGGDNI